MLYTNKKSTTDLSERSLQLLKSFVSMKPDKNTDILVVGGDLFDNIKSITYHDIFTASKIFALFKKTYHIDGNHDMINKYVIAHEILNHQKRTVSISEIQSVKLLPDLYLHFIPYYSKDFIPENTSLTEMVISHFKQLMGNPDYTNNSQHIIVSHAEIYEIFSTFDMSRKDDVYSPFMLRYRELMRFLKDNGINYMFFQGHYHKPMNVFNDENYYTITCFPKGFDEKVSELSLDLKFGYYVFDVDTRVLTFNEWPYMVKFVEVTPSSFQIINEHVLSNKNHMYVVKFIESVNEEENNKIMEQLKQNTNIVKILLVTNPVLKNMLRDTMKDTTQNSDNNIDSDMYMSFEEYFVDYLKTYVSKLDNMFSSYDISYLLEVWNTICGGCIDKLNNQINDSITNS